VLGREECPRCVWSAVGIVAALAAIATFLPCGVESRPRSDAWLETRMEAFAVEDVTIGELCRRLRELGLCCLEDRTGSDERYVSLVIAQPATRREVLRRLEDVTGGRVDVAFCTFGAPSRITLRPEAQHEAADGLVPG
jgi:hypothetical protein